MTDCPRCKSRRIPCDRTLPRCRKCISRNYDCPGYQTVLRWDQGVASRGKLAGRSVPLQGDGQEPVRTLGENHLYSQQTLQLSALNNGPGALVDNLSSQLLRHFDRSIATKLAWVDGPGNPWRNIILPMSHVSSSVLSSVLAMASQDLAYKYSTDHSYYHRLHVASLHYRDQALSSLGQQLGPLLRTPGSLASTSQVRCVLASTLLLYNLELLTAEAAQWRLHIQGARAIIQQAMHWLDPRDKADIFLLYEHYFTSVFIGLTTFDPTDGIPDDVPTNDSVTIFSDFVRIMHSVTKAERLKVIGESTIYGSGIEDVKSEIEIAKHKTIQLSHTIQFSSPGARQDFEHLTYMYYHASLIYSHHVLSDAISSEPIIYNSREAILDHLFHLTRSAYFMQDLVWPLFIAGTECRGLLDKQEIIEHAMIEVMRVSGILDRRRVLSFLEMLWRISPDQDVNWIHLARAMSAECGFLII